MEPIRYRPGEAIRWLQTAAESSKRTAKEAGKTIAHADEARTFKQNLKSATGMIFEMGKGALADLAHKRAEATMYALFDDGLELQQTGKTTFITYSNIRRIEVNNDRITLVTVDRRIVIRPYAYVVAGKLKVPIGWDRNGMEVPYELLLEELSARSGIDAQEIG